MKIETAIKHISHIDSLLDARRVNGALDALAMLLPSGPSGWTMAERAAKLRESYGLMSRYALDGMPDPSRQELYTDITEEIRSLSRESLRKLRMVDDPALYYSTARYEAMQPDTIASLLDRLGRLRSLMAMGLLGGSADSVVDPESGRPAREAAEEVARRIFNRVWTTHPLSPDDVEAISAAARSTVLPAYEAEHLAAALMLGELEFHDERRRELLMEFYGDGNLSEPLRLKALTGLLIGLWVHRDRAMLRRSRERFAAISELPRWASDVKTVNLELARARDTERINRKIRDEIIPDLIRLRPDLEKRMGMSGKPFDPTSLEENPEWQELLDKSGISDKLKEISELQEDGGDVMMSTFGSLKSFPFFNDVANWFLPFRADHSLVDKAMAPVAAVLENMPLFCDSDKFTLVCAMRQMPASNRDMIMNQFSAQSLDMAAAAVPAKESLTIAKWVQNIYRFMKLFRRKAEFYDIFAGPVSLASLPGLKLALDDVETLTLMSEFYFKRGYYKEAFELFSLLEARESPAAPMLQKMGYCCQQLSDMEGALRHYERSEMLNPDSRWTRRRLAACHRALGNYDKALHYYRLLEEAMPDDTGLALVIGHTELEAGRPADALKHYFKVEFLKPDSTKTQRPIAWASLLNGEYDRARTYYDRILAADPQETDWLNAGHLEMLTGNYRRAADNYLKSIVAMNFDASRFARVFGADLPTLRDGGVDDFISGLVLDNVLSRAIASGSNLK